jgi:nucleotide-binding universal stress UspA family protein
MVMNSLILLISLKRQSLEALHWSLHTAKQTNRKLGIIYVMEKRAEAPLAGEKLLEEFEKQARLFGVAANAELKQGMYKEVSLNLTKRQDVDLLVLVEDKKSFFKRILGRDEGSWLRNIKDCEVKVYKNSL